MRKHYGEKIIEEVLRMKQEGKTDREIGEKVGYNKEQIHSLVNRYRSYERKQVKEILSEPKGRPKTCALNKEEKLELENQRLQRENHLL